MFQIRNLALLWFAATAPAQDNQLTISKADGGSMVTTLQAGIAVNKGSQLRRRWFIVHDPASPIALENIGIVPIYKAERYTGSYSFLPAGKASAKEKLSAFRLMFVQFDIWGQKMKTLSMSDVAEVAESGPLNIDGSSWYASESDVGQFFTSVAYVDSVMRADGTIWTANRARIATKLNELQLKITESGLGVDLPPAAPPAATK